jgi:hypothetical protein
VLVSAHRGGGSGDFRSFTFLTAWSFGQARCSWSSLALGFSADEWNVVCAGAVDVVGQVVNEEESPWSYCDNT